MGERPDLASVTRGLGESWEVMSNTYKPYPCGVVLNPVIEACLALHQDPAMAAAELERIELTGHSLLRERTDRPAPRSGREAQVSAQHAVAVSLLLGRAGLDEFSDACLTDPPGKDVAAKLVFVDDDRYPVESATVTLHLRGGRLYAFWVSPAASGASHGYVAAGGPGFKGPTDTVGVKG